MWEQIWKRIHQLEKEVYKLKKENKEIKKRIQATQQLRIDKIEYKINELKVDTLSGTLNVGLSTIADEQSVKNLIDRMVKEQTGAPEKTPSQETDHIEPNYHDPLQGEEPNYFDQ